MLGGVHPDAFGVAVLGVLAKQTYVDFILVAPGASARSLREGGHRLRATAVGRGPTSVRLALGERRGVGSEGRMLRIYTVAIEVVRMVGALGRELRRRRSCGWLADQLERAAGSVVLNIAEGAGVRGGNRRVHNERALGSAREVLAACDVVEALGAASVDRELRTRLDHVIGTLVRCTR